MGEAKSLMINTQLRDGLPIYLNPFIAFAF
jgi:hypothetical protein